MIFTQYFVSSEGFVIKSVEFHTTERSKISSSWWYLMIMNRSIMCRNLTECYTPAKYSLPPSLSFFGTELFFIYFSQLSNSLPIKSLSDCTLFVLHEICSTATSLPVADLSTVSSQSCRSNWNFWTLHKRLKTLIVLDSIPNAFS